MVAAPYSARVAVVRAGSTAPRVASVSLVSHSVTKRGSSPPSAAWTSRAVQAWACSAASLEWETDRRLPVTGSGHRSRERYGVGRSGRT